MAKPRRVYDCTACGFEHPKWGGVCDKCGGHNTIQETPHDVVRARHLGMGVHAHVEDTEVCLLSEVDSAQTERISTEITELDLVLGGGLVRGSVTLIGGEPGIGKSTLTLQMLGKLAAKGVGSLYASGEESGAQIQMRAIRLGVPPERVPYVPETCVERLLDHARRHRPQVLLVDSIQTLYSERVDTAPGNPSQLKECTGRLIAFAKSTGTAVIIVGHVNKDGAIAGPQTINHMVDTTAYFEQASGQEFRILRTLKNRFGTTNEVGVFRMTEAGLESVANPSELFLAERRRDASGSAVVAILEGTRPLLVEIQALATAAPYGSPQRVASGYDRQRLALLLAVLEKHMGAQFKLVDVFVNVAGGLRILDTVADGALAMALLSTIMQRAIDPDVAILAEIGLGGELRAVAQSERRVAELTRMGFRRVFLPPAAMPRQLPPGIEVRAVREINELAHAVFGTLAMPEAVPAAEFAADGGGRPERRSRGRTETVYAD